MTKSAVVYEPQQDKAARSQEKQHSSLCSSRVQLFSDTSLWDRRRFEFSYVVMPLLPVPMPDFED